MVIQEGLTIKQKLEILSDAAKYDVACTSSGSQRKGVPGQLGSAEAAGICHTFGADGRCISLLKILYTNECVYDCKYCVNRTSSDVVRTSFTPEEVCELTIQFYRRNYIEGLFLSSGITRNPTHTMEMLYRTLHMLRFQHQFYGYIHVKAIPGADPELIERIGYLADRMSINLELPTAEGLRTLAPNKTRETILRPIRLIRQGMQTNPGGAAPGAYWTNRYHAFSDPLAAAKKLQFNSRVPGSGNTEAAFLKQQHFLQDGNNSKSSFLTLKEDIPYQLPFSSKAEGSTQRTAVGIPAIPAGPLPSSLSGNKSFLTPAPFSQGTLHREDRTWIGRGKLSDFVPAGQSTQMIIGASGEHDYQILAVTEALYRNFDMKRVFYSGFINTTNDPLLPETPEGPPLLREHRLYQADWLLRYYGFRAEELLSEKEPDLNLLLDPKCTWALRHLELFPVDVMRASYEELLRVPGIGVRSAGRILTTRKASYLSEAELKRIGVVLKRARYFLISGGRPLGNFRQYDLEQKSIESFLIGQNSIENHKIAHPQNWKQLSLFSDFHLT